MDVLLACEAFVSVAERGSFTRGAAAVGMSQSVVSRRIAALEQHLGGSLLDRATRRPALTPLGTRLLPTARRLVDLAGRLESEAEEAHLSAFELAVPPGWEVRDLAALELAGLEHDLHVVAVEAAVRDRAALVAEGRVRAALVAAPPAEATWVVPLGLAGAVAREGVVHLDALRAGRGDQHRRARVWVLPEDDVPHVRDPLVTAAEAAGLAPSQVLVATQPATAVAAALVSRDVVLASAAEAARYDLAWAPLGGADLVRGHDVAATLGDDARRVRTDLGRAVARGLGVGGRP